MTRGPYIVVSKLLAERLREAANEAKDLVKKSEDNEVNFND